MYELMAAYWPNIPSDAAAPAYMLEYARIWQETPKIVFSSTLGSVEWNSRLVRGDISDELARLRTEFDGDLDVSGATLASAFIRRGLVDEYRLLVHPVILGAGTPFFPSLESAIRLRLTDDHLFESGVNYLGYAAA